MTVTCGIVLAPRRLVAVLLQPGGEARRAIRAALTDDARAGLLQYLAHAGVEVVLTDGLLRTEPIAQRLAAADLPIWVAPDALVTAVARAAAITDPTRTAALLARLPAVPLLRAQLRRYVAVSEPRQVPLL